MTDLSAAFNPASVATNSDAASSALAEANAASVTATSADSVLTAWVDQGVKVASTPTFGGIVIADGGTIGQAAGPLVNFDDSNNYLEISGCNVGIETATPSEKLEINGDIKFTGALNAYSLVRPNTAGVLGLGVGTGVEPRMYLYGSGFTTDVTKAGDVFIGTQSDVGDIILMGNIGIGTSSPDQILHAEKTSALTNIVQQILRLTHITSGTPANNIGIGIEFEQETATDNNEIIATIEAIADDVTPTGEDGAISLKTMVAGAAATEALRVDASVVSGDTRLLLYDVDNATVERVTVGAADSGGAGFKVLRIPN